MIRTRTWICCVLVSVAVLLGGCSPADQPDAVSDGGSAALDAETSTSERDLEQVVARMAEIGWATGGTISPDGRRVAHVSSETGTPQVWIRDLVSGDARQATSFEDQVEGVRWSPVDDTLAVSVAPGGGLNTQIYLMSATDGEPCQITAGNTVNNWLGDWSDDGRFLTFASNVGGAGSMDAYLYDTKGRASRSIAENSGIGEVADLSPDGSRAVIWRMRSRGDTNLYLLDIETGQEQLLTPHEGIALSDSAVFADDDTVFIATNIDREMVALGRIDIEGDGNAGPIAIVAERDDAELSGFAIPADGPRAILLWNAAGKSELAFFDVDEGTMTAGPVLPAEIAGGIDISDDGEQIVLTISGSVTPQDVWRFDRSSQTFSKVSDSAHDGVELATLIEPTLVRYEAHDGLPLTGWLYMPLDAVIPVPMVTSFHGGPEGQERPGFRPTYQALLARGIGVFAPNVRGSSGFGKTFVNLDNGELRFNGIRDIESTVRHLVDSGVAEEDRIGIMGGSYGGYMVMAGLTEYPELFSAGANLFGVVNFETFFANTEPWMAAISTVEYGDPATQAELLERLSPIHKVDRVVAPTIVLHGANDTNVPVVEAGQVVESLEARDVQVKYVLFPDEGHGWSKTANRVTSDVEIVRWFESYLERL